jgi:hypothetical protein
MPNDTTESLRADIDSGRTRDKVRHADPAAAPLGSDDEAAGTAPSPERIALARSHEVDAPAADNEDGGAGFYVLIVAVVAGLLVSAVFFLLG